MCCICNYFWLKILFKHGLFSPSQPYRMAERPDVLKIFIGNLMPDVNKPKLVDLFARWNLHPTDVVVPAPRGDRAVAFVVFGSPREAADAVFFCNRMADPSISSGVMNADKNAIVEAFLLVVSQIVFRCCLRGKPLECELLQL